MIGRREDIEATLEGLKTGLRRRDRQEGQAALNLKWKQQKKYEGQKSSPLCSYNILDTGHFLRKKNVWSAQF